MKKFLAGLAVAAVLVSAFLAGLSILPHAHGDDADHSHHKACPVYQKSLHSGDALAASAPLIFAAAFCAAFVILETRLQAASVRRSSRSRAPPFSF